ncbi:MAG: glycosyltransferase [Nitrososphaeria archaeon]
MSTCNIRGTSYLADIVLGMITKNSYRNLGDTYVGALISSLQIPYDRILIVDSGDDETLEVASEFCHEKDKTLISLDGEGKNRARARQTIIDYFLGCLNKRWLMFLDDDCILKPNFFREAGVFMADLSVGLIWGVDDTEGTRFAEILRYRGYDPREYSVNAFKTRGGTRDTLLRRKALEGIEIPKYLHVFEDRHIKSHVEKVGYRSEIVYNGCWHHMDYHMIRDAWEYVKTYGNILAHRIVGDGGEQEILQQHKIRYR